MSLSIIHPCFNEQENIRSTVTKTLSWIDSADIEAEIIVVDDGSTDNSPQIIKELIQGDSRVKGATHEKNAGYGIAVRTGCDAAANDHIAFVDSDGQFHIEDLQKLLPSLEDFSFVTGRRRRRADPFMRNLFGKILGLLIFVTFGMWVRDVNCGMKVFSASTWKIVRPVYGTEKFFNTEIFLRLKKENIPYKQIDVGHYPRSAGSPTGASVHVIIGMFKELWDLKKKLKSSNK